MTSSDVQMQHPPSGPPLSSGDALAKVHVPRRSISGADTNRRSWCWHYLVQISRLVSPLLMIRCEGDAINSKYL